MFRILVPLDGSQFAEQALATAAALAAADKAKLELLHVVDFEHFAPPASDQEEDLLHASARSDAAAYLEHVARELKSRVSVSPATTVTAGSPAEQIQQKARDVKADLIVMATHGRGPADRAWLGSVADTLIRESATPVLLVRPTSETTPGSATLHHILVPLDGSALAEQILDPVQRIAQLTGARITLLRAVRPWVTATRPVATAPHLASMRERALADRQKEAREYLTRIAQSLSGTVDPAVIVCESSEASDIMRYAAEKDVDLIALATRGQSGLRRLLVGSVADKLIRGARVPVLVKSPQ